VHGFHVYGASLTPCVGEILECICEFGNREDPYTVAIHKTGSTVGHVPRNISCLCTLFLRHGRTISCSVTGQRKRSEDLPQGGLKVPCLLKFNDPCELVDKVERSIKGA
jgi:hypothetical protein